jgi:hypothetical protein
MLRELQLPKLSLSFIRQHIVVLSLFASAALILAWVGWLTWYDMSIWGKDIGTIFFGSRTGEGISLGIGMAVIHYFLIGLSLLAAGAVLFLRKRMLAVEPQQTMMMKAQKVNVKHQKSKVKVNSEDKTSMKEENAAAREERFFSGCLHHFGYLSSRPKDSPIPQECIICQRLGDCMVATVYVKKVNDQ